MSCFASAALHGMLSPMTHAMRDSGGRTRPAPSYVDSHVRRCVRPLVLGIQEAGIRQLATQQHDCNRVVVLERCGVSRDRADKLRRRDEDLDACLDLGLGLYAPCPRGQLRPWRDQARGRPLACETRRRRRGPTAYAATPSETATPWVMMRRSPRGFVERSWASRSAAAVAPGTGCKAMTIARALVCLYILFFII